MRKAGAEQAFPARIPAGEQGVRLKPVLPPDPESSSMPDPSENSDPVPKSYGNMSDAHWSRTRAEQNTESLAYLRERSKAPGVREGGAARNHYCMACNGVIPLEYDSREAASTKLENCPHCGVTLDTRVRAMFNWVEMDQVPASDLAVLWPYLALGAGLLLGLVWLLVRWLS